MESNVDRKINYRELQAIAKKMQLPGNLKYHLLVEVIEARKCGKEYVVERILAEQKLERVKRKREKLEAREAAYKHLHISQDRKSLLKSRKSMCQNGVVTSMSDGSTVCTKVQWQAQPSCHGSNIRSLLSMPVESFQELLKKSKEKEVMKSREIHLQERPFFYNEESLNQRLMLPSPNYLPETLPSMRNEEFIRDEFTMQSQNRNIFSCYQRTDYLDTSVSFDSQNQQEPKKASFQMRDILGQNDVSWAGNYGQNYCGGGSYDLNQIQGDVQNMPPYIPETFMSHYPPYMTSSDHWRNLYEVNQDSYNWRYMEYGNGGYQGVNTGSCAEAISPPNSDTISATDEDLSKEGNTDLDSYRYNSFSMPPLPQTCLPHQSNPDYQDSPYIPNLPTVVEENHTVESLLLPTEKGCLLESSAS